MDIISERIEHIKSELLQLRERRNQFSEMLRQLDVAIIQKEGALIELQSLLEERRQKGRPSVNIGQAEEAKETPAENPSEQPAEQK